MFLTSIGQNGGAIDKNEDAKAFTKKLLEKAGIKTDF